MLKVPQKSDSTAMEFTHSALFSPFFPLQVFPLQNDKISDEI